MEFDAKTIIIIAAIVLLLGGGGFAIYWFFIKGPAGNGQSQLLPCAAACTQNEGCETGYCYNGLCRNADCPKKEDCACEDNGGNGGGNFVSQSFNENFYDGKIDAFWKWNSGGKGESTYNVDGVKEELQLTAAGGTSQWTTDNSAPTMSFATDKDFEMEVIFNFDPKSDFQHAGIGIFDPQSDQWIRVSRSYDTHSLENQYDVANSLYVMEKKNNQIIKYRHVNFVNTKVYLRMTRAAGNVDFSYSRDGLEWSDLQTVQAEEWPQEIEVYLFAYSSNPNPVTVSFKNIQFNAE